MRKIKVKDLLQNASGSACPALATVPGRLERDAGGWKTCADCTKFFQEKSTELKTHKATEDTEFTEKYRLEQAALTRRGQKVA